MYRYIYRYRYIHISIGINKFLSNTCWRWCSFSRAIYDTACIPDSSALYYSSFHLIDKKWYLSILLNDIFLIMFESKLFICLRVTVKYLFINCLLMYFVHFFIWVLFLCPLTFRDSICIGDFSFDHGICHICLICQLSFDFACDVLWHAFLKILCSQIYPSLIVYEF